MRLTALGQAGIHIALNNGATIVIDPYLSDSLREEKGDAFTRLIPIRPEWQQAAPDILLLTHEHGDHTDFKTLSPWLDSVPNRQIFSPYSVFRLLKERWPTGHNLVIMRPDTEYSICGAVIRAVPAYHESPDAVGYLLQAEGKTIYFTGDTLFSPNIAHSLAHTHIDVMYVCINGVGNNMNAQDAARLSALLRPELAIPVHWDMFSQYGADPRLFLQAASPHCRTKILEAYQTIPLGEPTLI